MKVKEMQMEKEYISEYIDIDRLHRIEVYPVYMDIPTTISKESLVIVRDAEDKATFIQDEGYGKFIQKIGTTYTHENGELVECTFEEKIFLRNVAEIITYYYNK